MKKLNYLLIIQRFVAKVGESYTFPLGIAYISAVMKQSGFNVFALNLNNIEGEINEIIKSEIVKNKIDVVMLSALSIGYNFVKPIIDCVHYKFPQVRIIVGGGIITADPEVAMTALEHVDIGVIGEGEETVIELCDALEKNEEDKLSEIAGIIYKDRDSWTKTKARKRIKNLDLLPFPDYDGFEYEKTLPANYFLRGRVASKVYTILTARSCTNRCTFCFHTIGGKYRQRSIGNIKKEMKMCVENYGANQFYIADELFSHDKERVRNIVSVAKELGVFLDLVLRINDVDEEMVEILRHNNCTSVLLGLESASNKILQSMRKNTTIEQIEKALLLLRGADIKVIGSFIFGDIEENVETVNETLNFYKKHCLYHSGISLRFINVWPGTALYEYAVSNGIIKDSVRFLKDGCPNVNVSKMNEDEWSGIIKKILAASDIDIMPVKNIKNLVTTDGRMVSFDADCIKCNKWQKITLNFFHAYHYNVNCFYCKQSFAGVFPEELKQIFLENIKHLVKKNKKLGLWGVYRNTIALFDNNDIFKNERIIFIDSAQVKRMVKIHNKKVLSPEDALVDGIETVIFFYSISYNETVDLVKAKYPSIKNFIYAGDLLVKRDLLTSDSQGI